MVAIKARLHHKGSEQELIEAINACESSFKSEFPEVIWSFFEPDIAD